MLSKTVETILTRHTSLSIGRVLSYVEKSAFGFLLVMLSLPSALPVPAPGYSMPFGILLIIVAFQIMLRRKTPWFPKFFMEKDVNITKLAGGLRTIQKFIRFFEHFVRTRWAWIYRRGYRLFGVLIFVCGCSMLIPIPGTNTLPALGVFIIGLGMIEEDGFFGILGVLVALAGIALTVGILLLGKEALVLLLQNLPQWFEKF